MSGFLDDIPDIGVGSQRRTPKKQDPPAEVTTHKVVIWKPIQCPECGSPKVRVYSTRPPIRYHQCHECKARFKSVEER